MGIKETHTCEMTCDRCEEMFYEGPTGGVPFGPPDSGRLVVRRAQDGSRETLVLCDQCALVMREALFSELPIKAVPGEGGLTIELHMKGDDEMRQRRQKVQDMMAKAAADSGTDSVDAAG